MRCAFGVGVAILLWHAPLLSRAPTRVGDSARHRLMLNLTPFNQGTVRSAIDLALSRLARPGCTLVYKDFELPNGSTPQAELDRLGMRPEELLENLLFADGSRDPACRMGRAALTTTPGSRMIRVCPNLPSYRCETLEGRPLSSSMSRCTLLDWVKTLRAATRSPTVWRDAVGSRTADDCPESAFRIVPERRVEFSRR